jgi:Carbohydrate-binding module 48 (Isoamylase N-terminal domain)
VFDHEDNLDRVIAELRRPIRIDPALDQRVMRRISPLPPRRKRMALAPLALLGMAAALVALAVFPTPRRSRETAQSQLQFVAVVPQASRVALVGDFNDWDPTRTPMRPLPADGGTWTAVLVLSPGRYRYGFIVDGSRWMTDRAAPRAADEDFDAPSSVVTVGGL